MFSPDEQQGGVAPAGGAKSGGDQGVGGPEAAGSREAAGRREEENKRRSLVGHSQTNPNLSFSGRGRSGARKGK